MILECPHCGEITTLKQEYPYHAGFSNRGFLYCDSCPAILKFGAYNPRYVAIVGDKHPWTLNDTEKHRVENALKPCPTSRDGRFRFGAAPRCPKCNSPIPHILKDELHFVEIGTVIDADNEDIWV
jgi:hypothetical protein